MNNRTRNKVRKGNWSSLRIRANPRAMANVKRTAPPVIPAEAVAELRNQGRRARRLEGGFPEWKSAGLPVDRT